MKNPALLFLLVISMASIKGQSELEVRGLCIGAPSPGGVVQLVWFIEDELAPNDINTLVLRVDFNYAYESRPELRGENPLTRPHIKKIVAACNKNGVRLIPQVNLLGHQSWHSNPGKLLEVYPQFDETPHIVLPTDYKWPNEDRLYCKSYCPLHPQVHEVVFELIDEIMEVFEASAFHAGMEEVFYIADDNCPRCSGKDPAELFAREVNTLADPLSQKGQRLWIWGDRLLDGKTTGIGMWEASMNNTARAIGMITKTVVINDWHYEKGYPTPAYFATMGFDVVACPWRVPGVAREQVAMMYNFKEQSTAEMQDHFLGVMQTIWSSAEEFMNNYYGTVPERTEGGSQVQTLRALLEALKTAKPVDSGN